MKGAESASNATRVYSALSSREVSLLADWERERRVVLTMDVIRKAVGADSARDVAKRLVRKHALERIGRGKFVVRPLRTINRPAAPSSAVLAAALLQGEPYYLGGLWALTFHRLTEQQYASTLDAFVARRHPARRLGSARIAFHRAPAARLARCTATATIEGVSVQVSDPERTVLDLLDYPGIAGSSNEGLRLAKLALPKVSVRKLIEDAARDGRSSTCKRLSVLLERAGATQRELAPLAKRVRGTRSVLSMRQGFPRVGSVNRRWQVVENDR